MEPERTKELGEDLGREADEVLIEKPCRTPA
jgi:hypothetical protein